MKQLVFTTMILAAVFLTGCSYAPESAEVPQTLAEPVSETAAEEPVTEQEAETEAIPEETVPETESVTDAVIVQSQPVSLKSGTWAASSESAYLFYENENSGVLADYSSDTELPFTFESDGAHYVFHMGEDEISKAADVEISDDGNTAVIVWEDGVTENLSFVSENLNAELLHQTEETEPEVIPYFSSGVWTSTSGLNYLFYENGSGGIKINPTEGTGIPFLVDITAEGTVFYFGGEEYNANASVTFSDDNSEAFVLWEDGSSETLFFVDSTTDKEFAYHYTGE